MPYNLIAENEESTVVNEFRAEYGSQLPYQSEAELEEAFINQLQTQAYERLFIHTEAELIQNLRTQLELLNDYHFTDTEWQQFFKTQLSGANKGIEEKTAIIQEDHVQLLRRDDGTVKNFDLLEKMNGIYRAYGLPELEAAGSTGGSDAADVTCAGIPCIDSLGVEGGGIHSVREYARISSLAESAARLAAVAASL